MITNDLHVSIRLHILFILFISVQIFGFESITKLVGLSCVSTRTLIPPHAKWIFETEVLIVARKTFWFHADLLHSLNSISYCMLCSDLDWVVLCMALPINLHAQENKLSRMKMYS